MQTTPTPATSEELIAEARLVLSEAVDIAEIERHIAAIEAAIGQHDVAGDSSAVRHLSLVKVAAEREIAARREAALIAALLLA